MLKKMKETIFKNPDSKESYYTKTKDNKKQSKTEHAEIQASSDSSTTNPWHVFYLTSIGVFMSTLDSSIVNIALPTILKDFKSSLALTEWVVMIYLLSITSFLLTFGKLGDILGRKRIYTIGLSIFTLSSLFCGLSSHIYMLIASRFLQGLGSAMVMACTPALLTDAFPPEQRGRILGFNGAVVACGLTAGPAIGGFMLSLSSWRVIFYINIPIGILAILMVNRHLRESFIPNKVKSFDWQGTLMAALAISCTLIAITHGYEWGFKSKAFILCLILSLTALLLFILIENKKTNPMLDLKLFKIRLFAFSALCALLLYCSLFFMVFLMPFYLKMPAAFTDALSGKVLMIPFSFLLIFSPLAGSLSDRMEYKHICTFGLFMMGTGLFFLSRLGAEHSIMDIAWRLALVGIGTTTFTTPNSAAIMGSVPPSQRGSGAAVLASARNLGMVLGVAISGAVFNLNFDFHSQGVPLSEFRPELNDAFMKAFSLAMSIGAGIAFLNMLPSWLRGNKETK